MKHQNVFWGIFLIALGSIFLLDKLEIFNFEWRILWRLWPVLIMLWGVSILPVKGFIKLLLAIAVGFLGVALYAHQAKQNPRVNKVFRYDFDKEDEENIESDSLVEQSFIYQYGSSVQNATLKLEAAAGVFKLNTTTDLLIDAEKKSSKTAYNFRVEELDDQANVIIEQKDSHVILSNNNHNRFEIKLNPNPVWDFDMDIGAAELNFDLSDFKVGKIIIDGGASSIDLRLGEHPLVTTINVDAGASAFKLYVPESAGCRIEGDTFLSSKAFEGFSKLENGNYETSNFSDADQQVLIQIDAAISSLTVIRY